MKSLALCPGCARHVKPDETVCPFCQGALVPQRTTASVWGPARVTDFHASAARRWWPRAPRFCVPPACARAAAAYGATVTTDAGRQTVDAGDQTDAGPDSGDAAK